MRPVPRHVIAANLPPVADHQAKGGVWFLPSRNRAERARACMQACNDAGQTTHGILIEDGCNYTLQLPWTGNWSELRTHIHMELAGALTHGWRENRGKYWYGIISDGIRPITPNWDRLLLAASQGRNMVSCSDNGWRDDKRMAGITLIPGWMVEAAGYLFPPGMNHLYIDDMLEELGGALGNWVYAEDVVVNDHHHSRHGTEFYVPFDTPRVFKGKDLNVTDKATFEQWRDGPEFTACVNRIKDAWGHLTGEPWAMAA